MPASVMDQIGTPCRTSHNTRCHRVPRQSDQILLLGHSIIPPCLHVTSPQSIDPLSSSGPIHELYGSAIAPAQSNKQALIKSSYPSRALLTVSTRGPNQKTTLRAVREERERPRFYAPRRCRIQEAETLVLIFKKKKPGEHVVRQRKS